MLVVEKKSKNIAEKRIKRAIGEKGGNHWMEKKGKIWHVSCSRYIEAMLKMSDAKVAKW